MTVLRVQVIVQQEPLFKQTLSLIGPLGSLMKVKSQQPAMHHMLHMLMLSSQGRPTFTRLPQVSQLPLANSLKVTAAVAGPVAAEVAEQAVVAVETESESEAQASS